MKKTNKIIIGVLLIVIMLLGIGYAAIQNVTLNIRGTATADPNQANFKVKFSGTPTTSDASKVTAAITDDINATINVRGLTAKGETVTATYTVQNISTDLSADLSVATTNSNTEYFTLKAELAKTSLVAGEATTLTVTVTLTKTPVSGQVSSTIGIQLTATPVEPGQEGTSGSTNGSSQTPSGEGTLAMATNANIGDYIDLGNNIVGTSSTSDDWRVLYVEGDTVYAILADLLPNSTGYAENAGLTISDEIIVYKNAEAWPTINTFSNSSYWLELGNGFSENVYGTVDKDLLIKSINEVYGQSLDSNSLLSYKGYDNGLGLFAIGKDYYLNWAKSVATGIAYIYGIYGSTSSFYVDNTDYCGIRPVVELPTTTKATLESGVWKVVK